MKKKKLMFSEKYKRINGIYDIIDAFNILAMLANFVINYI